MEPKARTKRHFFEKSAAHALRRPGLQRQCPSGALAQVSTALKARLWPPPLPSLRHKGRFWDNCLHFSECKWNCSLANPERRFGTFDFVVRHHANLLAVLELRCLTQKYSAVIAASLEAHPQ